MHQKAIFPLALAAALLAGCDSAPRPVDEGALRMPSRDLTRGEVPVTSAAVASPLEIPRTDPERSVTRSRRVRRPAPAEVPRTELPETTPVSEAVAPSPPEAAPTPVAPAPATAEAPSDSRELAPGQTVTIIPASSGPSVGADPADQAPSRAGRAIMRGHGGTCRPRGAL